jgi:hypothetical protein
MQNYNKMKLRFKMFRLKEKMKAKLRRWHEHISMTKWEREARRRYGGVRTGATMLKWRRRG